MEKAKQKKSIVNNFMKVESLKRFEEAIDNKQEEEKG